MLFYSRALARTPPNMTRLLYRWGLGPIIAQKALKCDRLVFINGDAPPYYLSLYPAHLIIVLANTGRLLGAIALNEEFLKDLIADMLLIQVFDRSFLFVPQINFSL